MAPAPLHLRVFLSSLGDVADERNLARTLLKSELPYRPALGRQVSFWVESWDDPAARIPMLATLTPQQSVDRGMPKPSACHIVVVVLWGRMGTPLPDHIRKPDGTPYLSGTEWEYEDAVSADPAPEVLVYRRLPGPRLDPDDPNFDENLEQYRRVKQFFERFRSPDGSQSGGYHKYDTPTAFKELLEQHVEALVARRLREAAEPAAPEATARATERAAPAWPSDRFPYPGLRAFTSDESAIFFGRGREVDRLIAHLRDPAQRFLCVVGAAGTGKSSLVRAGLLPRVLAGGIEGGEHWRVLTFTPGTARDYPFLALAARLEPTLPEAERESLGEIPGALAADPARIITYATPILTGLPGNARLVLFADQLEELFTLVAEPHRPGFIDLLAHAAADGRLRVLATLRADFFVQATASPPLAALLQSGNFPLAPPDQVALNDMIRRPAERAGLALEDGLADAIRRDAGDDPGALPLVAFCLETLYLESPPPHALTLDAYEKLGRLEGAIGRAAEARVAKLPDEARTKLPQVFHRLVHLDGDGTPTRRRVPWREFGDDPAVRTLLDRLIAARLLHGDRLDGAACDATVEVAHEAVFRGWPQLRGWLVENRTWLLRREEIAAAMARWGRERHDRDFLLPAGKRVAEAIELVQKRPDLLLPGMQAYIEASARFETSHRLLFADLNRRLIVSQGVV